MKNFLYLVIVSWLLAIPAQGIELGGYYENDVIGVVKKGGGLIAGDFNHFRLKMDAQPAPNLALHLEPRYYFLIKSEDLPSTGMAGLDQLIWDRVYAKASLPLLSITAGKQRIAWGSGYIWNPTDIFNPYILSFAVREEDRANVEAVRVEVPIGEAGGMDAFVLTGKPWEETAKGLRVKGTKGLFDISASYIDQKELGHQIGLDAAGDIIKDVGVRSEVALITPPSGEAYIQSVWGWEYTLDNGVGLNLEYFFNGAAAKDYLYFGANKILDELTRVRGSLIMNLEDSGFIFYPQYMRSLSQELDLSLEAMLVFGPDGAEYPAGFDRSQLGYAKFTYNF